MLLFSDPRPVLPRVPVTMKSDEREHWIGWTCAVLLLIVGAVAAVWFWMTS